MTTTDEPRCITVGIAGGTGSGKTTLAHALYEQLGGDSNPSLLLISHDSYYRDQSDKPLEERAQTNFDHPDALETSLLVQHLQALKQGHSITLPHYDFTTHTRLADGGTVVENERTTTNSRHIRIILLEGILVLTSEALRHEMDIKIFVDADADIRFIRRMARDTAERGRTVDDIMHQYQTTVRPMHEQFVEPSKHHADMVVFSTTHSLDVAVEMVSNHLKVKTNMMIDGDKEDK